MVYGDRQCSETPKGREAQEGQQTTPSVVIPKYGIEQKGLSLSAETVQEKRSHSETCNYAEGCSCEAGSCMCGPNCSYEQ